MHSEYVELAPEDDMQTEVARQMAAAADDPRQQLYFARLDHMRVVKSQAEYERLAEAKVRMVTVSYNTAVYLEQCAAKEVAQAKANKRKRKAARVARRGNR
jgi:hypothetical protein